MKAHWRKAKQHMKVWHYMPERLHRAPCGFKKRKSDEVSMVLLAPRCATCEQAYRREEKNALHQV